MEKTIRELASELNISKEAIYRKINHSMKIELSEHIIKKDGKTYISEIGQSLICQSLKREIDEIQEEQEQKTVVTNKVTNTGSNVTNIEDTKTIEYIKFLEKQIDLLQTRYDNEVNNNRQERETLYKLNQSLIDTFSREQHLQFTDKQLKIQEKQTIQPEHNNESTEPEPQPKGFLEKLFKRK